MKWFAQAPANIALIKYMGKSDSDNNIPCNASLSYALKNFLTYAELEMSEDKQDRWEAFVSADAQPMQLSASGIERYIAHLNKIKKYFSYSGHFIIRTANNFPADCGLASSASSFAALTLCTVQALVELTHRPSLSLQEIAELSRLGSGSSCRSIMTPWALWTKENIETIALPYPELIHHVIVVDKQAKKISSRAAHRLVTSSALFFNRPQRAEQRLEKLIDALQQQDWQVAFTITWQEFWDMHALFETCAEPFSYLTPGSIQVLTELRCYWQEHQDGPLVTIDAGPNIHLLFRPDQHKIATKLIHTFMGRYDVL